MKPKKCLCQITVGFRKTAVETQEHHNLYEVYCHGTYQRALESHVMMMEACA